MDTDGLLSGTPPVAGAVGFTVTAEGDSGGARPARFPLPVTAPLVITTGSPLPPATTGASYSETLIATGGSGVFTWSAAGLPPWLSLSAAGVLTGTPPGPGNASFTVTVIDSTGVAQSAAFALAILAPPLVITTTQLAGGTTGVAYTQTVSGTGGQPPFTWSVPAGSPPTGLALAASTGVISGTPLNAGSFPFTIQLSDSAADPPATQQLVIVIASGLTITTAPALPPVTAGASYAETLSASGGIAPITWSVTAGALPAGLTLDAASGAVSGTPSAVGTFTFTARVADSGGGIASQTFTVVVASPPAITTASLPGGTEGASYSQAVALSGGTAPFNWTVASGALPAGLAVDASDGVLSGTPTSAGSFSFTLRVKDASSITATQSFTVVIAAPLAIVTAGTLPGGTAAIPYSEQLQTSGGTAPLSWSVSSGGLPPGLNLSTSGALTDTPSDAASSVFTAQVRDAAGAAAVATFSLNIVPALAVATVTLPPGEVNVPFSVTLDATGGTPPYAWSLASGALPSGLTLSPAGSIQGTPTTAGVVAVTVQVTDAHPSVATQALRLIIVPPPAIATPAALPTGVAGSDYAVPLIVSGGIPPFHWAVTAGALPPGLVVVQNGGVSQDALDGVPHAPGTFNATLTATDAAGVTSSRDFTVIIIDDNPALAITLTRCICGPLSLSEAGQLTTVDTIVDGAGGIAIAAPGADGSIQSSTILGAIGSAGTAGLRTLEAGNSIFTGPVFVERRQTGCVRFCYLAPGSRTPRRYRSQPDLGLKGIADALAQAAARARLTPVFTSLVYGQPGYAQLRLQCADEIRAGAEDGSEMGAFDFLKQPQREQNLRAGLEEFLRFGLEAGIIFVT
jgi:hypothetical protein